MLFKNSVIKQVLEKFVDVWSLNYALSLLGWDTETYMPKESIKERSIVFGRLSVLQQRFLLSDELRNLVRKGAKETNLNDYEAGIVRTLKRRIEKYEKLPPEFVEELEKVRAKSQMVWREARQKNDYNIFKPSLQKIVELTKQLAEYWGYEKHPYNALLDYFEEGLTVNDVEEMFSKLKHRLTELLKKITTSSEFMEHHPLEETAYDVEKMKLLNKAILELFYFNFNRGRYDISAHPFTAGIGITDVRLTTRYKGKNFKESLLATIHEFGHATYAMQTDEQLIATPIARGVSSGVHESQSRFWENMIGRSFSFIETNFGLMKEYLPFLEKYTPEDVYKYFNLVKPELIRVEANEVTYNQHILIRFELEKGLIEDSLTVDELPALWNEKMEKYLGLTPPNDALGVLQDIHWSGGAIGYFPTYSMGTILAVQFARHLEKDLGNLDDLIRAKKYKEIKEWLREKVHKWGSTYPPKVLIQKALGEPMNPDVFLDHIEHKYKQLYNL
ncbi:MAG: carboxypeptidase M32 [Candidatus Odinarchaeota archaeon]|nr:carboxypeptidase M32 [Candidatus Odinarchaeota archaeon]